jgi:hypothetical protein
MRRGSFPPDLRDGVPRMDMVPGLHRGYCRGSLRERQIDLKVKVAALRKGPGLKPIGMMCFIREAEASRSIRKSKRGVLYQSGLPPGAVHFGVRLWGSCFPTLPR